MGYTKLEAAARVISMLIELFTLAVSSRRAEGLACYKGSGTLASVLLADYVGSIEAGEIQALEAYTGVVSRSDYIPAPASIFLSNVIAHNTQCINDGKLLAARDRFFQSARVLTINEYMKARWPDGACEAYMGIALYSKAVAGSYDSVGRFVKSLGPACPWAQAMHDVAFYYNDITDCISDIALGEPMNLFIQARDVSADKLVWLASAIATVDYVGSLRCSGCTYHQDSEDCHYGSCLLYLASTRYCAAPQLWLSWAIGDSAPRWQEIQWRSFTKGWTASRWPFTDSWQNAAGPITYDIVEHLALRLGVNELEAKNDIKSILDKTLTVPEMVRSLILLGFRRDKYLSYIQDTIFMCLRAYGYGTGLYTLPEARSDSISFNVAHSSLLDRFYSELEEQERTQAIRVYCGLLSALCELTELNVYGHIAAYSAAALSPFMLTNK